MKTLLIWNMVPEETDLYLIPDAPEWLDKCCGFYVNGNVPVDVTQLLLRVSDAVCTKRENCENPDDELATAWVKYKVDQEKPLVVDADTHVVLCGFYL